MKVPAPSLAPILRSAVQGRLLAAIVESPGQERPVHELARMTETTLSTAIREIDRAESARLVTTRKLGNTRLVQANRDHPLYPHIAAIIAATFGVPDIVTTTFRDVVGIERMLIVGSWAARWDAVDGPPPNDIDLLVLGTPARDQLDDAADVAERRIGLPVEVIVRPLEMWQGGADPFIAEVKARPYVDVTERLKGDTG